MQAAGRSIRSANFGQAAQTAQATARGVGQIGGAAPLSTVVGLAAVPAAAAAAAASLQTIPPLLVTIGGGLGAIPGLAAGAAAGIGTLKLATVGLGDAIEEVFEAPDGADPYDRLTDSGKRLVDVLASQKAALLGVQQVAQQRTFANLDSELQMLGAVAIPFATRQAERFGTTWNSTLRQLARVGRNPEFLAGIDAAAEGADRFFDNVNTRIGPTSRSLGQLFIGSRPFVDAFGDSLLGHLDDFNAWIDRAAANGDLEDFFRDAAEQADALLDVGKEVLVLVGRIGGLPYGGDTLRDMADALERFNDAAHNTRSVEGVIATGNAAVRGLVDVLVILGETLGETLADPATRDAVVAFFDILKVAAQVVTGLVGAFSALPGPVQSTVLVLIALTVVFGKLFAVAGRMGTAVGAAAGRLDQMGPAGQRAGRGLQAAAMWAGRAATALVALQVAGIALEALSDSAVKVDALNRSLKDFVQTGKLGGELTRQFGDGLEDLDNRARGAGDGWFPKLGRAIESILPPAKAFNELFFGGSFTGDVERFRELDAQLKQIAESTGDLEGVNEVFRRLRTESGLDVAEFNKLLPETAAWLAEAQAQAHGYSATQQALSGSMEDAIGIVGSYTRAWKELNGAALTTDEALLSAKDALDKVKESFDENGRAITGNSRAALENRVAVGQFAQAAAEAAQAKYEESGSIAAANKVYDDHMGQLRKTLTQAGLTDGQIKALIGTFGRIPPSKTSTINVQTAQADKNLRDIIALSAKIKSKTVVITVDYRGRTTTRAEGRNIPIGDGVGGRRWGGITEHAQTGLLSEADIYAAASSRRYAFAEAETGGEAFIPRYGMRDRSVSIGRRAMEWYDMDVVPHGALPKAFLAGMTAATAQTTKVDVPPLDPAVLAAAIRSVLQGVQVVMDGRTVGYMTGREAGIYART
ncbi:hypothetical protein O7626_40090 [Micromonospora sp. WMMD1102]|uniref:hypothetical protein n=1 Tax=Micromonospora sp. WMMD1102 TaxID=3016105 RepID=UPI00241509B9|nr:hypothetical protein [Micromonospora sp. WMMD1102]MDG4792018.1 hypothetical protein [Micromonospora sp. WMMD1102]